MLFRSEREIEQTPQTHSLLKVPETTFQSFTGNECSSISPLLDSEGILGHSSSMTSDLNTHSKRQKQGVLMMHVKPGPVKFVGIPSSSIFPGWMWLEEEGERS